MGRLLAPFVFAFVSVFGSYGIASISILTGAVLLGADRVFSWDDEARTLDRLIDSVAIKAGEVCVSKEHHRYDDGLSYLRVSSLKSSLEANRWVVKEAVPFLPFQDQPGAWLAVRGREVVLILLIPVARGPGYVSFCLFL